MFVCLAIDFGCYVGYLPSLLRVKYMFKLYKIIKVRQLLTEKRVRLFSPSSSHWKYVMSLQLWQAQKIKQVRFFSFIYLLSHSLTQITIYYHLQLLWYGFSGFQTKHTAVFTLKGRVGKNGETSSSALEFETTQPKKICPFLQTSLQSPSSNTQERAHDQWGHEISLCTDGRLTGR